MLIIPVILDGYRTLKDKTFKVVFGTNELTPEQASTLQASLMEFGYLAFKPDPFKKYELDVIDGLEVEYEDTGKRPSQRLRAVLYRLWEQEPENYQDFNLYYEFHMNKIISHFKEKLD